jgi:hypothetical protein
MTTRTTCCDVCGQAVIENLTRLAVECGPLRGVLPAPWKLCGDCSSRLLDFARGAALPRPAGASS